MFHKVVRDRFRRLLDLHSVAQEIAFCIGYRDRRAKK